MTAFLFVHGINVRGKDLERTLDTIRVQLDAALPHASLTACTWGDELGARLRHNGSSIPNYSSARGLGLVLPEIEDLARWQFLYADPFFELRLMADATPAEERSRGPAQFRARQEVSTKVEALPTDEQLGQRLSQVGWNHYLSSAAALTRQSAELKGALDARSASSAAIRGTIARSIFARMAQQAERDGMPALQATQRTHILRQLEEALGGSPMGVVSWLAAPLIGFSQRLMTRYLERKRGSLSDLASPVVGDVILYQGRGDPIRQRIRSSIASHTEPVFILAHSLGGVAVVDTLLLFPDLWPKVRRIVTVGSQAGFFYENGALVGLAEPDPLPSGFPAWTNFFDSSDMLSYLTVPLLGTRADDRELTSGQPFPQSHSAYWTSPGMWAQIAALASE